MYADITKLQIFAHRFRLNMKLKLCKFGKMCLYVDPNRTDAVFSLTPLVPAASPTFSFNPSSLRGSQGDAHKGEKTVTVLHHGASNDAPSQPLTEEKMTTETSENVLN